MRRSFDAVAEMYNCKQVFEVARATFLWSLTSLRFDWALFTIINVDQRGGKTESERFQRLLAMTI